MAGAGEPSDNLPQAPTPRIELRVEFFMEQGSVFSILTLMTARGHTMISSKLQQKSVASKPDIYTMTRIPLLRNLQNISPCNLTLFYISNTH